MPTVTVTLFGEKEAQGAISRRSGVELMKATREANKVAGNVLKPIMASMAPVWKGVLRASVKMSSKADASVNVRPTAPHRHLVIRGTARGVEPNPFVDRAVDAGRTPMRAAWEAKVKQQVAR